MHRFATLAAATLALAASFGAHAVTVSVTQNDQWYAFDIDDQAFPNFGTGWIDTGANFGEALSFSFILNTPTYLRVIDAGHAGDRFNVSIDNRGGITSLTTGAAVDSFPSSTGDYDTAWANNNYSRLNTMLAPGSYFVTGDLLQAAGGGGAPLNVTTGALMLTAVPEPGIWAMLFAGLGLIGSIVRRRA